MEMPGRCQGCGEERMVMDAIHGVVACDACGRMGNQAETELRSESQTGHVIERRGTYVGDTDSGVIAGKCLMRGQVSHSFSTPGNSRWSDRHRLLTMKKVECITALLRVPGDKVDDAKKLLESTLDGDWGTGRWVDILVAACVYIVIRQSQLPLTVPEVADSVNCDVVELGRMYNRVVQKLEISMPSVNIVVFLERAALTLPALRKLGKEMSRKIIKQGIVLLDYAQACFVATGRRQLPVVAAVLSLVIEANKVVVEMAEVARELHAGLYTTKRRYKECRTALVGMGQSLPWGKDITLKTLPRHLSFLLQYLETKTKFDKKKKGQAPSSGSALTRRPFAVSNSNHHQLPSVAPRTSVANTTSNRAGENDIHVTSAQERPCSSSKRSFERILSGPNEGDGATGYARLLSIDDQQGTAASDDLSDPLSQARPAKMLNITGCSFRPPKHGCRGGNEDIFVEPVLASDDQELVEGVPEATEPKSIVRDSAGNSRLQMAAEAPWEALPASFCANLEARTRRQAKIKFAKSRISETRRALNSRYGQELFSCDSPDPIQIGQEQLKPNAELGSQPTPNQSYQEPTPVRSYREPTPIQSYQEQLKPNAELGDQPTTGSLDSEDLLIEHLLLCGASEAVLESGYYRSLLTIYPVQSDAELMGDDDLASYIRSRSEVELLLELTRDPATLDGPPVLALPPSPLSSS